MQFVKVLDKQDSIKAVYDIIRLCGKDMYENQGLVHWRTPYPQEKIQSDCTNKDVYLAICDDLPIATFQLSENGEMIELSKFAVLPDRSGQGIGGKCLEFIENECKTRGFKGINLDVYDKSSVAVNFYLKKGFKTVGTKSTRYFQVLLMEKYI